VAIALLTFVEPGVTQLAKCLCEVEERVIVDKRRGIGFGGFRCFIELVRLENVDLQVTGYSPKITSPLEAVNARCHILRHATGAEVPDR
jgi:hypothetical protein